MTARQCLECGTALPGTSPGMLCPTCALLGALQAGSTAGDEPSTPRSAGEPRSDGPAERTPPLGPGDRFGDYELLDEIARGGMGVVYRARQVPLDRMVAIKMLLPSMAGPESLRRFRAEASTAAGLHHPHVVAIHDVGTWHGQPYLVMDLVEGSSLARVIMEAGPAAADFRRAAGWLKAVAAAVQFAHDRGILHRDLKPSNVLIDERGEPRVTDFGLAKHVDEHSHLTLSGQALGSPSYMPPEQTESGGGRVSRRSDVYGIGATLYHLLTGRAPFKGETPTDVLHQVLTSEPAAPRALNPAIPRDLETICLKCLEKDPGRRYASAQDVADELGRFLDGHPIVARPVGSLERLWRWCRRKPLAAALVALLAVSLGMAGWLGWQARQSSRQLAHERMQRAIDAALAAAWAGDRATAEAAIVQAQRNGAPAEWVPILNGQVALYTLRIDDAVAQFEQAVALAPRNVAARAMLANAYMWRGEYDRSAAMMAQVGQPAPETPEDYLFLGSALIMGSPDTSKAVSLLEVAKQKRPSGMTFLLLGLAESSHALDAGSWPTAQNGMKHSEWGTEILGAEHREMLPLLLNAYNAALRLSPEAERAAVREKAGRTAAALDAIQSLHGQIQRAFYLEITGDFDAALATWQRVIQLSRIGLSASGYAAAMLQRGRSAEAVDVLARPQPQDGIATLSRAYLLLDERRSGEAKALYEQVAATRGFSNAQAESILLLAGQRARVATNARRRLDATAPVHAEYQVLRFWAGRASADDLVKAAGSSRFAQSGVHHLIGMTRLAEGDRAAARRHFKRAVETGSMAAPEYHWSRAFLARLDADPRWPAWIP